MEHYTPSPSLSDQSTCTLETLRMVISYMYDLKTPDRVKNRFLDYVYNFWILHLFDTKTPDRNPAKDSILGLRRVICLVGLSYVRPAEWNRRR